MSKTIVAEGKTTNEAISNGLNELGVSREDVIVKVLDNTEKRSFFSILAPRVVKVELTLKERNSKDIDKYAKSKENIQEEKEIKPMSEEDIEKAKENLEKFLQDFARNMDKIDYSLNVEKEFLNIEINGENSSKLIGYRGETLNSLQVILNSIANKGCNSKIRVIVDIANYKEKRKKDLEELADKISKTVLKNGKSITLEPMMAYERKIIHSRLQQNDQIKTYSIGDEPYRKVVIAKNK